MAKYDHFLKKDLTTLGLWTVKGARERLFARIRRFCPAPKKVLEIGPGRGIMAQHFMSQGAEVACCDNNAEIVAHLKSLGARATLTAVPPLPEPDETFDLVLASHVFEHLPNHDQAVKFVEEAGRVLKKGGVLCLFSPNILGWKFDFYDVDYTHSNPVTPHRMKFLLPDAGLALGHMENFYGNFGTFPGWLVDKLVTGAAGALQVFFPMNPRLVKAKVTFHANLLVIGVKN